MSENGHILAKLIFVLKLFHFIKDLTLLRFYNNWENLSYHSQCSIPDPSHINDFLLSRLCADSFGEILHGQCRCISGLVVSC